ncbi:NAD-dependent succinate-semialdehyde dehydrogenase [Neptunomonas antarctica]|uniref:Succinate-semialdehyde dehydrogenase / glutarate-semialdehyde dehydrogenase n=1 Tax=Neptunomonas antarctica TaxID=619304 RepID=A0A1N7NVU0_9GAMM|nr:NAD-dependent succinate-semialdehyde dehydrogenase [Neptunomonas antarctica]SIT02412.1 succinate-semialdehyde dehydrogenase / glutarate-semialdehyde dehydrogenase [Neptunomonas antarctica]
MTSYQVTNPANGEIEEKYDSHSDQQVRDMLSESHNAYQSWRTSDVNERTRLLNNIADLYDEQRKVLAKIMACEMGKPVAQGEGELALVSQIFRYYATYGEQFLETPELPDTQNSVVKKESIGVLLGIMPWNYPHYQVARFIAPNLMLGNAIMLKHAPSCPQSATAITSILAQAGLPKSVYNNVFVTNEQVKSIINDKRIQGVSLTGSERAGAAVAQVAGAALKKVVLELGGSDPFIVLADADIDHAVECAFIGRFGNAGQACNAAKRIILHADIYDDFVKKLTHKVESLAPADPLNKATFLGPLSSAQALKTIQEQYDNAVNQGATVLVAGGQIAKPGAWFKPALLADITSDMKAYHDELFGPVAVVYKADDVEDAIRLANDTPFGLGACIHTQDMARGQCVAERLEVGMVAFNQAPGSAAELPFGGVKQSGFGRELGPYGMSEFVNFKLYHK